MAIFGSEPSRNLTDYISRLEKMYKKYDAKIPKIVDNDVIRNIWETTPDKDSLGTVNSFTGHYTGNTTNSGKIKIIDNDPRRNIWESTPNAHYSIEDVVINMEAGTYGYGRFPGFYTGTVTNTGKIDKNWNIHITPLVNTFGSRTTPPYDVGINRWWYKGSNNRATYLDSVPTTNGSKPTLYIHNRSTTIVRSPQFPTTQQNLNSVLLKIYNEYDFGPDQYNDSLSPYQITHNEFGSKTYVGTLRNASTDGDGILGALTARKYENRTVLKNILISQGTSLLQGVSGMFGGTLPISLANFDTTGAGIQSAILFLQSTMVGMAVGMGMLGSMATNSLIRNLGFPTKASYGVLRPSDSTIHNRYTIDGKGINQGLYNKTPFGVGELVQDIVNGENTFESLGNTFNVEIPGIIGMGKEDRPDAYPLYPNMLGYYSVLSYSQIKILQVDNAFRKNTWIDFREYITDGRAYHTPGKKDTPKLVTSIAKTEQMGVGDSVNFNRHIAKEQDSLTSIYGDGSKQYTSDTIQKITETNENIVNYKNFNPEDKFGFSRAGTVGMYKKNFTRMQESIKERTYDAFTMYPIEKITNPQNITPYVKLDGNKQYRDYIKFMIYDVVNKELIRLRATISDVSETITPTWETSDYVGKADPVFTYKTTQRKFSFSFTMYSNTRAEFLPMWRKINKLYGLMYPTYADDIDTGGRKMNGLMYFSGSSDITYEQNNALNSKYGITPQDAADAINSRSGDVKGITETENVLQSKNYLQYSQSYQEMKTKNMNVRSFTYFMSKGRPIAPFIMLTLGDWFVNEPGYLSDLTISVDNNFPWEINLENDLYNVAELPHLVKIQTGFQPIGKKLFENGNNFFGWNSIGTIQHEYQKDNIISKINEQQIKNSKDNTTKNTSTNDNSPLNNKTSGENTSEKTGTYKRTTDGLDVLGDN